MSSLLLYRPINPYFAAIFNTNCLFLSSPAAWPIGTYHSPVKRHLWYSTNLYGFCAFTRLGSSNEKGGVNCRLSIKLEPDLGNVGASTDERCSVTFTLILL